MGLLITGVGSYRLASVLFLELLFFPVRRRPCLSTATFQVRLLMDLLRH